MSGLGSAAASRFLEQASVACTTPEYSSRLSVIVPCYNEAATVAEVLRRVRQALPYAQCIVIDDGSTDGCLEQIKSVQQQFGLHVQSLASNSGKGAAFRAGLELADRDYVVIQDADLEYDPADIAGLLRYAIENSTDVVYGSRYLRRGRRPGGAWGNYFAVVVLSQILRQVHGLRLTDPATGYKLFHRDWLVGVQLRSQGFELCQELNRLVAERRTPVVELPVSYQPRSRAEGKKIRTIDFWHAVRALFIKSSLTALMMLAGVVLIGGCYRGPAIIYSHGDFSMKTFCRLGLLFILIVIKVVANVGTVQANPPDPSGGQSPDRIVILIMPDTAFDPDSV
jgi:glycosyltransferase involved in cell wall biosynthesis